MENKPGLPGDLQIRMLQLRRELERRLATLRSRNRPPRWRTLWWRAAGQLSSGRLS